MPMLKGIVEMEETEADLEAGSPARGFNFDPSLTNPMLADKAIAMTTVVGETKAKVDLHHCLEANPSFAMVAVLVLVMVEADLRAEADSNALFIPLSRTSRNQH